MWWLSLVDVCPSKRGSGPDDWSVEQIFEGRGCRRCNSMRVGTVMGDEEGRYKREAM